VHTAHFNVITMAVNARLYQAMFLSICFAIGLSVCCFEAHAIPTLQLESDRHYYHLDEHVEYLEDKSGLLDLRSIRQQDEKAWAIGNTNHANFGFSDSAYWFRINIEKFGNHEWFLEIDYPLLDEISLYLLVGENLVQEVQTGDSKPYTERPLQFREFVLPLDLAPTEPVTLYLRVKSAGAVQVPMNLRVDTSFYERDELETAALGLYFGAILVMILYNLFLFIRVQEAAYIYYVLYVTMFGFFTAALTGWGYKYMWPEAVDFQQYSLAIFIIMGSVFVCRFIHYFLDLPKQLPRIRQLLDGVVYILFALLFLLMFVSYNTIVQMALVMTMIICLIALYSGIQLWRQGVVIARYFTLAWGVFLVAVILATLEKFGVLPLWIWASVILPGGMAMELILLSLALGERINSERQQRLSAQDDLIGLQRKNQAELEQKVQDRTMELERANALLTELATTDALTGIINRRRFMELGEEALNIAIRYKHAIAVIMLDIDHFKEVNDNYGHAAGDKLLQHVASICSGLKRETDIIGRLGGEEFGFVLLEPAALSALMVAGRIQSTIEASPIDYEGVSIGVTVSQGVSHVEPPQKGLTFDQILRASDDALYEAKHAGRNRIVEAPDIYDSPIEPST